MLTGDETTIERAAIARILVSKIPSELLNAISGTKLEKVLSLSDFVFCFTGMIVSLTGIVESWETERGTSFLYDKVYPYDICSKLLQILYPLLYFYHDFYLKNFFLCFLQHLLLDLLNEEKQKL